MIRTAPAYLAGHAADTVIGREVTIGHQASLHGCTVGDRALVGMGATLLEGSVVRAPLAAAPRMRANGLGAPVRCRLLVLHVGGFCMLHAAAGGSSSALLLSCRAATSAVATAPLWPRRWSRARWWPPAPWWRPARWCAAARSGAVSHCCY